MNIKVKNFLLSLGKDRELGEQFSKARTAQEAYRLAEPYLEGVSFREFRNGITEFHSALLSSDIKGSYCETIAQQLPNNVTPEVCKKELEELWQMVAGGQNVDTYVKSKPYLAGVDRERFKMFCDRAREAGDVSDELSDHQLENVSGGFIMGLMAALGIMGAVGQVAVSGAGLGIQKAAMDEANRYKVQKAQPLPPDLELPHTLMISSVDNPENL